MTGIPQTIREVLDRTDWQELAESKLLLTEVVFGTKGNLPPEERDRLDGLLDWIDGLQDAAADAEGYPVIFLTEDEE